MMKHAHCVDLDAMVEGIRRWVQTESPSRNAAAVNRMVDLVQSDVADLRVTIERIPGQSGLGDLLVVRTGEAPGICSSRMSILSTRWALSPVLCRCGATAIASMGREFTT